MAAPAPLAAGGVRLLGSDLEAIDQAEERTRFAALLVVCGFMFGPPANEGQIEPISSGSLAAYLLGATLIVLNSSHADVAMIAFGLLVAGTVVKYAVPGRRLKQSGMRWTVRGANAIIALRCCELSGRWESFWEARSAA